MKKNVPNSVLIAVGATALIILVAIAWRMFGGSSTGSRLEQGDYKNPPPAASAAKSSR